MKDASGNALSPYTIYLCTTFATTSTSPVVVLSSPQANATNVGTNVKVQLEFSADMNQSTQAGMTLSAGGTPVAVTYSWNSGPYCSCGSGTVVTFTPAAPLNAATVYTVVYTSARTDTSGNPLTPGSFNFTTGAGPDTANSGASPNFYSGQPNIGTNFTARMTYSKPVNPITINTSNLIVYNVDSGKYVLGTVAVAPDGLSATFTPTLPLLPQTGYYFYQGDCYCDMNGNYLYGSKTFSVTGTGSATTTPTVVSVLPVHAAG